MITRRFSSLLFSSHPPVSDGNVPDITAKKKAITYFLTKYRTPLFFIDKKMVLERYNKLSRALVFSWGKNYRVAYSFKTNYDVAKSKILKKQDVLAEVVSGYEYTLATQLGYAGSQIVFNGPIKRNEDLIRAFYDGALVHIDNHDELVRVIEISNNLKKKISVGIRINTSTAGVESRFGFLPEQAEMQWAVDSIKKSNNLVLTGLHMHVGSDMGNPVIYKRAAHVLIHALHYIENAGVCLKYVDVGGGFPGHGQTPYQREPFNSLDIEEYIQNITRELSLKVNRNKVRLIVEPGRYLVDDAGIYMTRIYSKNIIHGASHVLTDGAITMLPLVYYRPQLVRVYSPEFEEKIGKTQNAVVFGGTCKEDDVLFRDRLPGSLAIGDYVIYFCVGAYNQSMGSDFIFGKPSTHFL